MKKNVIALGVFDGVHRGHQALFRKTIDRAKNIKGLSIAYTFDPHPVRIVAPSAAPQMINTTQQRIELIKSLGIQKVVVQKFTKKFSQMTPENFFRQVIVKRLAATELFTGYNFTFGIRRSGNVEHLEQFGKKYGIGVHILKPYLAEQTLVSSTQVRQFIQAGKLGEAEQLLDRPYFIEGKVIKGRGIGGKQLGFHTANIQSENDSLLPTGVYVTYTRVGKKTYQSLTNIGPNPTFGQGPVSIETHIREGFSRNIVGKKIRIFFLKKIRDEIRFNTPLELADQIKKDIQTAKKVFSERS